MAALTRVSPAHRSILKSPLRVVCVGGGTGLSNVLSGLKRHARGTQLDRTVQTPNVDITAIVTVTDDGGSSGRLRRDFDILAPGDIRNCMTALSEDEALLSQLFRYRFATGRGLKGHSFGNLFLTAMNQITGDFAHAVKLSSEILAIRGRIFPSTSANVTLEAVLANGSTVRGETRISKSRSQIECVRLQPEICDPLPETLEELRRADLITFGPGSLYTSLIPNVLVHGIAETIANSPAIKVCFVNLMWQPGETTHFTASQHIDAIHQHARRKLIDCVVLNSAPIPIELRKKYARAHAKPVENDIDALESLGIKVVTADLVCANPGPNSKIRHDAGILARVIVDLASRSRAYQVRKQELSARTRRYR